MSRLISEPLTNNATKEFFGPLGIVYAPGDALAIAEVKLGKVAVKMAFLAMLIHTLHTTFEDGEKALHGVSVNGRIGKRDILPGAMADGPMLRKMFIQIFILTGIIGHNPGFMGDILFQDRNNGSGIETVNYNAPGFPGFPVYQGKNLALMGISPALGHISLIPEKGFVNFHGSTIGAKRSQVAFSHGFTDTVSHEPSGFKGYSEGSMKLVGAKAFLGSRQQIYGLEPEVHRNVAIFKDGSNLYGKLFAAGIALMEADPGSLAVHFADAFPTSAMRADRAVRP
jgi:hypothetical protein